MISAKLRKQGWTTRIESSLGEKRVDIGASRGPVMHAYEVVNEGLEKELSNLTQDLEDGWERVIFCVGNEQIKMSLLERIEAVLGAAALENVDFRLLPTFR